MSQAVLGTTPAPAAKPDKVETPFRRFVSEFAESKVALFGLCVFTVIALVAILAPFIAPQNPYDLAQLDIMDGRQEPGTTGGAGFTFWLGTDDQGRDMLSGIMYGLRISLMVGAGSAFIACLVGGSLGLLAAYAGGRTDTVIMRLVDLQLSFPAILTALMLIAFLGSARQVEMVFGESGLGTLVELAVLALLAGWCFGRRGHFRPQVRPLATFVGAIAALLLLALGLLVATGTVWSFAFTFGGKSIWLVVFALIIVEWSYYARTVRGTALVESRREYMEAAQCLALPTRRILFRHLLPNCMPPLIVVGTMQVARAIALEATLSFLGLGVPITEPSLGLLIANGYEYMLSGKYWISFYPGIALLVTIVSINLVGDQLRDVLNPRLRK